MMLSPEKAEIVERAIRTIEAQKKEIALLEAEAKFFCRLALDTQRELAAVRRELSLSS